MRAQRSGPGRVHFRRTETRQGATDGDGGHGGYLSRLDEVMLLDADYPAFGLAYGILCRQILPLLGCRR